MKISLYQLISIIFSCAIYVVVYDICRSAYGEDTLKTSLLLTACLLIIIYSFFQILLQFTNVVRKSLLFIHRGLLYSSTTFMIAYISVVSEYSLLLSLPPFIFGAIVIKDISPEGFYFDQSRVNLFVRSLVHFIFGLVALYYTYQWFIK